MNKFGFTRVAAGIPFGKVCGIEYNAKIITEMIKEASKNKATVIVFPELSITSYTIQDLFQNTVVINESINACLDIAQKTKQLDILSIIGAPIINNNKLYNCAVVL